jgi:RimJ/RimL family protein N-acetyltransferase
LTIKYKSNILDLGYSSMIKFEILEKGNFHKISKNIFTILADNMSKINPTNKTFDEDYIEWFKAVGEGIKKEPRNIILIYYLDEIIGFFQYYSTNDGLFMMEEIQISPLFQGSNYGIFRKLYGFIIENLPKNIETVETFVHKKNIKSQKILIKLGLKNIGVNKNGNSYHYKGSFIDLINWYKLDNTNNFKKS